MPSLSRTCRRLLPAVALISAVLVAGCASNASSSDTSTAAPAPSAAATSPSPGDAVANVLYDALDTPTTSGRADLVAVLLTGINIPKSDVVPTGLQFTYTGTTQADLLRVNTGIKPNAVGACVFGVDGGDTPSRLGAIAGDLCGFPNGRRLLDDVTDIELRALVEGYGPTLNAVLGVPNRTPNNLLGDGVDDNDMPFLSAFPYAPTPHAGYEHTHHKAGPNPMP